MGAERIEDPEVEAEWLVGKLLMNYLCYVSVADE